MSHWDNLNSLHTGVSNRKIVDLFADKDRFENFSATCGDMLLDYSKVED